MSIRHLVFLFILVFAPIVELASQDRQVHSADFDTLVSHLGYDETKKALRLRERFIPKEKEQNERRAVPSSGGSAALLHLLAYGLIFVLVVIIIYMVFSGVQVDKKINIEEIDLDEIEDIDDIDADAAYKAAVAEGDYRLAIRMQFIKCLQVLSAAEYIEWEKEKTNRDYTREIKNLEIKRSFRELATVFERTWYGGETIGTASFRLYDQQFLTLFNSMK